MEHTRNCCRPCGDPAEAIAILMEISNVSKRLASNLAKLAEQEKREGGTENEQNVRTGCCCIKPPVCCFYSTPRRRFTQNWGQAH